MTLRRSPRTTALLLSVSIAAVIAESAHADTVGYWRFEENPGFFNDSGPNNLTLNADPNIPTPTLSLGFPTLIPSTGAPNLQAADIDIASFQAFSVEDNPVFAFQDFTIEAFVSVETAGAGTLGRSIAAQFGTGGQNLSWRLLVTGEGSGLGPRNLVLQLSSLGNNTVNFDSNFQLTLGANYYVAASVDFTATGNAITFYFQDLTNSGALQTTTVNGALTSMFDATVPFRIGAGGASATDYFDGRIDEVRLSNTNLGAGNLLIAPEPSTGLMALAGMLMIGMRRKRKEA